MNSRALVGLVGVSFILLSLLHVTTVTASSRFDPAATTPAPFATDHILVKFTDSAFSSSNLAGHAMGVAVPNAATGIASVDALSRALGVTRVSRSFIEPANRAEASRTGVARWFTIQLPVGTDIGAAVARYATDSAVETANPDWRAFPAAIPTDPLYANHWGHNNTSQLPGYVWAPTYAHVGAGVGTTGFDANAQAGWDNSQGFGSSSVIIAIIDSGVNLSHPDLTLVTGYDYGDNDANPEDNSTGGGHGTCCAGVAAAKANNGLGACGAAPGCRVMPLKVANSAGSMFFSAIVNAIYYAADHAANVISMSLGAAISSDAATDAAISYANTAGVTILAATGNENRSTISYPAINTYVIGVGASSPCGDRKRSSSSAADLNPGVSADPNSYTCDGERWWGSNYGVTTAGAAGAVDILAPTILPTTDIQGSGGYESGDYEMFFNGTSCATPYAAGVCGLIKSQNPSFTPAQVKSRLTSTAIDIVNVESGAGWDRYSGYGEVDIQAATAGGGGGTPPTANFSGTPTSGTAPLTVNFTDQSTGSPTSWSWTFGDAGTSTAQNPSHAYATAGTYTVALTATNASGFNTLTRTAYITVTTGGGTWTTITYDTFESGMGSYTDGGADMSRYTGGTYAYQGVAAADIQDNGGTASSFTHTLGYNVSAYTNLEVNFYFRAQSMETGEDFWVQYYNGSAWQTVATYASGTSFSNGTFYVTTVTIPRATYNYPTNAKIRFRCDASDNNDDVYIDAITFRGFSGALASQGGQGVEIAMAPGFPAAQADGANGPRFFLSPGHPNPFAGMTTLSFSLGSAGRARIDIYDVSGRQVDTILDAAMSAGEHQVVWQPGRVASGVYFAKLVSDGQTATVRMMRMP